MQKSIIIVGAGVIGSAIAYRLAGTGARVTVVDSGQARATDASFGWINASFFLSEDHYHLRVEGMDAWHRFCEEIDLPISWCGSICWEEGRLDLRREELVRLGYDAEILDAAQFAQLEPHVADPPEMSLHLGQEGVADPSALAACLLAAAQEQGATVMRGVRVTDFLQDDGRVIGVRTQAGDLFADEVCVVAGVGSRALMGMLEFDLPMLHRPALAIKTASVPKVLDHILVNDIGEVRQLPCGALVMPAVAGHQGDDSEEVPDLEVEARNALARLQALVPDFELTLTEAILAERPMPGDGLPAVGHVQPGAYVATMHSGITLAAIMGELVSNELLNGETNQSQAWLAPYRPTRFVN